VSVAVMMTVAVLVLVGWLLDDRGLGGSGLQPSSL
jgi:hypothetical protein